MPTFPELAAQKIAFLKAKTYLEEVTQNEKDEGYLDQAALG